MNNEEKRQIAKALLKAADMLEAGNDIRWHNPAMKYLQRLGAGEYKSQLTSHLKKRAKSTFKYFPSQYHSDLISLLGKNDEEGFKALKMTQGYASIIKV